MTETATPRSTLGMISLMTPDPRRLGAFWSEVMGLPITAGASDDLVMLDFNHEVGPITWILERSDDVAVGTAPVALDIHREDEDATRWREVADRAEELGAARVSEHEEGGVQWIEMRDPDGNRFRVFAPRPVPTE